MEELILHPQVVMWTPAKRLSFLTYESGAGGEFGLLCEDDCAEITVLVPISGKCNICHRRSDQIDQVSVCGANQDDDEEDVSFNELQRILENAAASYHNLVGCRISVLCNVLFLPGRSLGPSSCCCDFAVSWERQDRARQPEDPMLTLFAPTQASALIAKILAHQSTLSHSIPLHTADQMRILTWNVDMHQWSKKFASTRNSILRDATQSQAASPRQCTFAM